MSLQTNYTTRALKRMYTDSYNNLCALENLSVNPHSYYSISVGPKANRLYNPYRSNRNGKLVNLPIIRSNPYLRFSLAINIFGKEDKIDKRKNKLSETCVTLAQRSALNRLSMEVFVDNIKVPDDKVYITVIDGTTDLYVPAEYFEENGSMLDIITRKYSATEPYINYILRRFTGGERRFTLYATDYTTGKLDETKPAHTFLKKDISHNDIRVYKNGRLLQERQFDEDGQIVYIGGYTIINYEQDSKNSIFTIEFSTNIVSTDIVEICIEPDTNYRHEVQTKQNMIVTFPKDIDGLDPLMPISPGICDIYMEGMRLFAKDIEVISPRIFRIKDTAYRENGTLSVFINYNGKNVPNIDFKEDSSRYLHTVDTKTIEDIFIANKYPDSGLTWLNEQNFPGKDIYRSTNYCCDETYDTYVDKSIQDYIQENAHNIIQLLSQFSVDQTDTIRCDETYNERNLRKNTSKEIGKITYQTIDAYNNTHFTDFTTFDGQTFTTDMVLFTTKTIFKDAESEDILVTVDNVKIKKNLVNVIHFRGSIYVYVNKDALPQNRAYEVTLLHIPIYNKERKYVIETIDTAEEMTNMNIFFSKDLFGSINNIDDLLVYKQVEDGWQLMSQTTEVSYATTVGNDGMVQVYIPGKRLNERYLVLNSSFYVYSSFVIDETMVDLINTDTYSIDEQVYLPVASEYSHLVFINGVLQIEGIDYFITNQLTHAALNQSRIIFNNRPNVGDEVEVYFYEQPHIECDQCKVLNYPQIPIKVAEEEDGNIIYRDAVGSYDAIYIKDCETGFSNEYMELYIDDKLIPSEYIVEIALNLVLLKDLPEGYLSRPYNEVYVKTRFSRDMRNVQKYISWYNKNQSDFKLYIDRLYSSGNIKAIGDIVKAYVTDQTPHEIDITAVEITIISPIIDLIARHIKAGILPKRIDANVPLLWLNKNTYLQMMSKYDLENPTIDLNANHYNISIPLNIDPTGTAKSLKDITEIVSRYIKDKNFPFLVGNNLDANKDVTDQDYYNFDEYDLPDYSLHPISSELYLEELHLGQPDYDQKVIENRNIDANINIENTDDTDFVVETRDVRIPFTHFRKQPKFNSQGKIPTKDMTDYLGNIVYDEEGNPKQVPDLQFIYSIDLSRYSIDEFLELRINNVVKVMGNNTYMYSNNHLAIMVDMDYSTKIDIKYKTRIYMK